MDRPAPLATLASIARAAGAAALAEEAAAWAERTAGGRFYVACMGQFKRGKSSLVNALLGQPLLPTGVRPVTSVVTLVRHGERPAARVRLAEGWVEVAPDQLAAFVTETENPGNRRGVRAVEVFAPCPLLASGLCLADTPGLGSVFAANSAATREFLPQVDAVVAVLGADPPLSGEELDALAQAAVEGPPLLLVLNKADRLPAEDRAEAIAFAREQIEARLGAPAAAVYEVSAAERLAGSGPRRDWDALVARLSELAAASAALVRAAEERGRARLQLRLAADLDEQRRALTRPLAESADRLARIERAVGEAGRALDDLAPLLARAQARFAAELGGERERFLATARAGEELDSGPGGPGDAAAALGIARRLVGAWRLAVEPRAEALYVESTRRFVERANALLGELAAETDTAAGSLLLAPEAGFRRPSRFYFNDLLSLAEPPLGTLTAAARRRHARGYLVRLLDSNGARVVNDLEEQFLASRRDLEREIRERLRETAARAAEALSQAREVRERGAGEVRDRLDRLDRLRSELERI